MKTLLVFALSIFALGFAVGGDCAPVKHHIAASPTAAAPVPLTTEQITAKTLPDVVSLTIKDANGAIVKTGSGVVISTNTIATCYHVIDGASTITVNFNDGRSVTAYGIYGANKAVDVAIIGADTKGLNGIDALYKNPNLGAALVAVGSPEGLNGSVSTGIVSGIRSENARTLIQTTAPISPGSSGGALVDGQGRLVGITSELIPDGENINFAISTLDVMGVATGITASFADLKEALGASGATQPLPATPAPVPAASAAPYTDKPLTGVTGMVVVVENLDQDSISDGLQQDVLSDDINLELHKDGVPVDSANMVDTPGHGYFYVQPTLLKLSSGDYAYTVNEEFNERATLPRPAPVQASAYTWTTGETGYVPSDQMVTTIRQVISDMVDKFATEYLAENPK